MKINKIINSAFGEGLKVTRLSPSKILVEEHEPTNEQIAHANEFWDKYMLDMLEEPLPQEEHYGGLGLFR